MTPPLITGKVLNQFVLCYNEAMASTEISKIIADTFYITFLPKDDRECQFYIDFLEKYINKSQFDRLKFIRDAKNCNEDDVQLNMYEYLLPVKDLRNLDEDNLEEIEKTYQENHSLGLKGGYIRAILEILYDKKYQESFNSVSDRYLENVWNNKENLPFSIVLSFMNLALLQFSKKDYICYTWNTDRVTQINAIGSTKAGKTESVDNPYSAYKVYAQGEYSKLLIGYKAADEDKRRSLSLSELAEYGFDRIFTDKEICTYSKKVHRTGLFLLCARQLAVNSRFFKNCRLDTLRFHEISTELIIIIPTRKNIQLYNSAKLSTGDIKDNLEKEINFERNILIVDLQTDAIQKILQRFNNYILYTLDSKRTVNNKSDENKEITVREEIHNQCRNIYFSHYKDTNLDSLDIYEEGKRYTESEAQFIDIYFGYVIKDFDADKRLYFEGENVINDLNDDNRNQFDIATNYAFVKKNIPLEDKIEALYLLVNSNMIELHPFKDRIVQEKSVYKKTLKEKIISLKNNPKWQEILCKSHVEKANMLFSPSYSPEVSYFGHSADEETDALNFSESRSVFSETNEYAENEYVKKLSEEDIPEEVEEIKALFQKKFPGTKVMAESMKKYFKRIFDLHSVPNVERYTELKTSLKHTIPEKKKEIDSFFDSLEKGKNSIKDKETENLLWGRLADRFCSGSKEKITAAKIDFGFLCLDKEGSWNGTWNRYCKYDHLGTKENFRENMYSIYEESKNIVSGIKTRAKLPDKKGRLHD